MSELRRTNQVSAADLPGQVSALLGDRFRLALVAAHEDPDAFRVVYLFTAGAPDRRSPSYAASFVQAEWTKWGAAIRAGGAVPQ